MSGVSNGSAKKEVTVAWSKIGTDAGIDTEKSYTINKVDADNYGLGLANAVFTVYKYDGDDNDSNDKAIATYTTDANGHITITKSNLPSTFTEGKFYYFKETKAPSGYELPDSPRKYYFYYNTENTITPTGVLSGAVNLAKVSDSAYVENEKIKTIDLTINKKWFTADGDETSRSDGSITYDVIQVATAEDRTSTESTYLSGKR